ncbi:hypothetical protein ACFY7Z_10810 [Streptomyces sp. NPDC012623]|uniref:hypothetical protein n=1 Tax=unclassified Streptomyces TaxID=2593676 RepID=UPI00369EC861
MNTNPPVSALVNWTHTLGRPAVCLGRLIVPATAPTPVVVLSEIAQNPDALGISGDFPAAATAAWAALAAPHTDPGKVSWYAHHGPFSSYDPTCPETLTEVTLTHGGTSFHGNLDGHRLLSSSDAQRLLDQWKLDSVVVALGKPGRG